MGVLFLARHLPLVLGDELAVFVVVEAGKGKRIGKGRLKVISDDLAIATMTTSFKSIIRNR